MFITEGGKAGLKKIDEAFPVYVQNIERIIALAEQLDFSKRTEEMSRLNTEMVSLRQPDEEDLSWLRDVVARHRDETGSDVAERVLADWGHLAGAFVKVMPNDYQRVLDATRAAEAEGRDVVEAIMEASRI